MLQQSSRALQLAAEVTEERDRLGRIGHSELLLPADHVVWAVSGQVPDQQSLRVRPSSILRIVRIDLLLWTFQSGHLSRLKPTIRPQYA